MRRKTTLEFYADSHGEYRWRMVARNGETLAGSSESFVRLVDAKHNADLVTRYRLRPGIHATYDRA